MFVKEVGVVFEIVVDEIGVVVMLLGVGCVIKEDEIDLVVGIMFCKKVGDKVEKGEFFVMFYVNCENVDEVVVKVYDNICIVVEMKVLKLIYMLIME